MSEKHTDALVAASEEVPALVGRVFVTEADAGVEYPYLVWHPSHGVNTQERVSGPRSTRNPEFTGHVVGSSARMVQRVLDALEERLFPGGRGVSLVVDGERSFPLSFACPLPIQKQTDPQPSVIYGVVEVGWRSDPV